MSQRKTWVEELLLPFEGFFQEKPHGSGTSCRFWSMEGEEWSFEKALFVRKSEKF